MNSVEFCTQCGAIIPSAANFCTECGVPQVAAGNIVGAVPLQVGPGGHLESPSGGMAKKRWLIAVAAVVLAAIYVMATMYASNMAERKVNDAIVKIAKFADIEYKSVRADIFGNEVHVSDITVRYLKTKDSVRIAELVIHDIDDKSDMPAFLSITANGIVQETNSPESVFGLDRTELGYVGQQPINFYLDYSYNHQAKELSIKKFGIAADNVCAITLSARVGNVDLQSRDSNSRQPLSVAKATLNNAKLVYADHSFFDRLMTAEDKKIAKRTGAYRAGAGRSSFLKLIEKDLSQQDDQRIRVSLNNLKKFVEDPSELTIIALPSHPVPIDDILQTIVFKGQTELFRLLNLQIE